MKAIVDTNLLLPIVTQLSRVADKNHSIDALKGVLIEADEESGELHLTATNLLITLKASLKASVSEPGSIVFLANYLCKVVKAAGGEKIVLESDGKTITIQSGSAYFVFPALSGKAFPNVEPPIPEAVHEITGICTLARQTIFAAINSEEHPTMKCIRLLFDKNGLASSATDGSRFVVSHSAASGKADDNLLIPAKSFRVLASISEDTDVFQVGKSGMYAVFSKPGSTFVCRLEPGNFFDPDAIIKNLKPIYGAKAPAKSFRSAVDLVSPLLDDNGLVELLVTKDGLRIAADSKLGKSSTFLPAETSIQQEPKSAFYYPVKKLLENFEAFSGGHIVMLFSARGELLIKGKDEYCFQVASAKPKQARKKKAA